MFEFSTLNELYRGKLVRSSCLYPLRYFDDIWYTYIYQVKTACHIQEWLLPLAAFGELSPLNEFYRGKLVRSITLILFVIF